MFLGPARPLNGHHGNTNYVLVGAVGVAVMLPGAKKSLFTMLIQYTVYSCSTVRRVQKQC